MHLKEQVFLVLVQVLQMQLVLIDPHLGLELEPLPRRRDGSEDEALVLPRLSFMFLFALFLQLMTDSFSFIFCSTEILQSHGFWVSAEVWGHFALVSCVSKSKPDELLFVFFLFIFFSFRLSGSFQELPIDQFFSFINVKLISLLEMNDIVWRKGVLGCK